MSKYIGESDRVLCKSSCQMGHDLSQWSVLLGLQLKTDLQALIGTPLGFCLLGRSRKFNLDARWVIAQKSWVRIAEEILKEDRGGTNCNES